MTNIPASAADNGYSCIWFPRIGSMSSFRYPFILSLLCFGVGGSCIGDERSVIPADFLLIVDAQSAGQDAENVNVRIDAGGKGRYERYKTGGVIRSDVNGVVTYEADQVRASGEFKVSSQSLQKLWAAIAENGFFELTGDYRMAIGHSYAFILVEGAGRRHQVFNVGMEVPEIGAIVEATVSVLPDGAALEYRGGYLPDRTP